MHDPETQKAFWADLVRGHTSSMRGTFNLPVYTRCLGRCSLQGLATAQQDGAPTLISGHSPAWTAAQCARGWIRTGGSALTVDNSWTRQRGWIAILCGAASVRARQSQRLPAVLLALSLSTACSTKVPSIVASVHQYQLTRKYLTILTG
jgi:hypothetical protein